MVGWSYDAAGNLLSDGSTTAAYDALGRVVQQGATANSSNGDGALVAQLGYAYDVAKQAVGWMYDANSCLLWVTLFLAPRWRIHTR